MNLVKLFIAISMSIGTQSNFLVDIQDIQSPVPTTLSHVVDIPFNSDTAYASQYDSNNVEATYQFADGTYGKITINEGINSYTPSYGIVIDRLYVDDALEYITILRDEEQRIIHTEIVTVNSITYIITIDIDYHEQSLVGVTQKAGKIVRKNLITYLINGE